MRSVRRSLIGRVCWLFAGGRRRSVAGGEGVVMDKLGATRKEVVVSFVFGLGLVVIGVVWLDLAFQEAVFIVLIVVAAVNFALRRARPVFARSRFGQPVVSASSSELSVGDHFHVAYQQQWRRAAEVDRIVVRLVRRETVRYSDGSTTHTDRHEEEVQRLETSGRRFEAGEVFANTYAFQIPPDGMHTFAP